MPTFRLVKTMPRSLTAAEETQIITYWEQHQDLTEDQLIVHFEAELQLPITHVAVRKALIRATVSR